MTTRKPLFGLLLTLFFIALPCAVFTQDDKEENIVILEDGYSKTDLYLHISQSFKSTNIDSAIYYADQARISALKLVMIKVSLKLYSF